MHSQVINHVLVYARITNQFMFEMIRMQLIVHIAVSLHISTARSIARSSLSMACQLNQRMFHCSNIIQNPSILRLILSSFENKCHKDPSDRMSCFGPWHLSVQTILRSNYLSVNQYPSVNYGSIRLWFGQTTMVRAIGIFRSWQLRFIH